MERLKYTSRKPGLLGALRQRKNPLCRLSFQEKDNSVRANPTGHQGIGRVSGVYIPTRDKEDNIRGWKFLACTVLVFLLQFSLILSVGRCYQEAPVKESPGFQVVLASSSELDQLSSRILVSQQTDPSLFALPNLEAFSGNAWAAFPNTGFQWDPSPGAKPEFLKARTNELGAVFLEKAEISAQSTITGASQELETVTRGKGPESLLEFSTWLEFNGSLSDRRLINFLELPAWREAGLIGPTRIELTVDSGGRVISASLLTPGSGYKLADEWALTEIRKARFNPLSELESEPEALLLNGNKHNTSDARLVTGQAVFHWGIQRNQ